ncbi:hypothetical protein NKH77_19055 [Streptomyces sp. M19]
MDIGPVIAKRYRIKREIGSGGMGSSGSPTTNTSAATSRSRP